MPELPEVESVRRGLARAKLRARPLDQIWRSKLQLRTGAFWREERLHLLEGATGERFDRRGKFLLWHLRAADQTPLGLVIHLGMTGRVTVEPRDAPRVAHTHVVFGLGDRELHYVDPRRFGGVRAGVLEELRNTEPLVSLGPEPLGRQFDATVLRARGGRSKRAIRDVLLDQRVVAGLGNIYVSEALFVARVHPLIEAHRLRPSRWERLAEAIVEVLEQGLRNGGTSLRDYRNADGEQGSNQNALLAYGRGGQPCARCEMTLTSYVHSGRSGVYCRACQR